MFHPCPASETDGWAPEYFDIGSLTHATLHHTVANISSFVFISLAWPHSCTYWLWLLRLLVSVLWLSITTLNVLCFIHFLPWFNNLPNHLVLWITWLGVFSHHKSVQSVLHKFHNLLWNHTLHILCSILFMYTRYLVGKGWSGVWIFSLPAWLIWTLEVKTTLDKSYKANEAWGLYPSQTLALIDQLNQFIGLWLLWSFFLTSTWIKTSEATMLAVLARTSRRSTIFLVEGFTWKIHVGREICSKDIHSKCIERNTPALGLHS